MLSAGVLTLENLFKPLPVSALEFNFSSPTILEDMNTTGSGLRVRYANVATDGGTTVDVIAEVLGSTSSETGDTSWYDLVDFGVSDDNASINIPVREAPNDADRQVEVRYNFVNGNNSDAPLLVEGNLVSYDIDDNDFRTERIIASADELDSYSLSSPSNIRVTPSGNNFPPGSNITFAGSASQKATDPEGSVLLSYDSISEFTLTYSVDSTDKPRATNRAALYLDGDFSVIDDTAFTQTVEVPFEPNANLGILLTGSLVGGYHFWRRRKAVQEIESFREELE